MILRPPQEPTRKFGERHRLLDNAAANPLAFPRPRPAQRSNGQTLQGSLVPQLEFTLEAGAVPAQFQGMIATSEPQIPIVIGQGPEHLSHAITRAAVASHS